jgi:tRNA U34 5-carboxymethylaminomethyl modifying enzyme MnmG/GidA
LPAQNGIYQVIVIGGGHAGVEGAIDATRSADATDRAAAQILAASLRTAVMALASG